MGGLTVGMSVPLASSALQASPANSQVATLLPGLTDTASSPETARRAEERARRATREQERRARRARVDSSEAALRSLAQAFEATDEAEWAYADLMHGIALAREHDEGVPCVGPGADAWTSEDPTDRELAADLCLLCPLFALCKRYADEAKPSGGVWAGEPRGRAARQAGLCAKGLHDLTAPEAHYVRKDGQRECIECKRARNGGAPVRVAEASKPSLRGHACACDCNGRTRGGRYLPGHDARHLARLVRFVKAGALTQARALDAVAESPGLQAKLRARLSV